MVIRKAKFARIFHVPVTFCAVELTNDGKVKRFYALKIKDFSAKSLSGIFDKHISKKAKITTDNWKGYRPISKDYNISQIPSQSGANFKALHTMIASPVRASSRVIKSKLG